MLAAAFYPTERISSHFFSNLQPELVGTLVPRSLARVHQDFKMDSALLVGLRPFRVPLSAVPEWGAILER